MQEHYLYSTTTIRATVLSALAVVEPDRFV
jgi:hypothetical protein